MSSRIANTTRRTPAERIAPAQDRGRATLYRRMSAFGIEFVGRRP